MLKWKIQFFWIYLYLFYSHANNLYSSLILVRLIFYNTIVTYLYQPQKKKKRQFHIIQLLDFVKWHWIDFIFYNHVKLWRSARERKNSTYYRIFKVLWKKIRCMNLGWKLHYMHLCTYWDIILLIRIWIRRIRRGIALFLTEHFFCPCKNLSQLTDFLLHSKRDLGSFCVLVN